MSGLHEYLTFFQLQELQRQQGNIMTKLSELAAQLSALTAQNDKANAEIINRIDELEAALSDVELPSDAIDALAALRTSVQKSDDVVLDAEPEPEPAP